MSPQRYRAKLASYLMLVKEDKVLMVQRKNGGWQNGFWGLPAGHVEQAEFPSTAMIREAKEEVDVTIAPADLIPFVTVFTIDNETADNEHTYTDFYFLAHSWLGLPRNMEPEKCGGVEWHKLDNLPEQIIPNVKIVLEAYGDKKDPQLLELTIV